ncbi:MAG: hypothetical protein JXB88_01650 [Spirochaetales bacterium]|nr:hypothetical protein [Spirochaetales bacterium]
MNEMEIYFEHEKQKQDEDELNITAKKKKKKKAIRLIAECIRVTYSFEGNTPVIEIKTDPVSEHDLIMLGKTSVEVKEKIVKRLKDLIKEIEGYGEGDKKPRVILDGLFKREAKQNMEDIFNMYRHRKKKSRREELETIDDIKIEQKETEHNRE